MKINNYFGVLLTVGLALTACSSDDSNTEQVRKTYTMTIDATKGANEAASRATTRALTLDGSTLNASWATSEHVYVQGKLFSNEYFWFVGSIQPQYAGTTTRLNGTISLPAGWTYSSVNEAIGYPNYVTLQFPRPYVLDYTGQIGSLADISAKYDYARAEEVRVNIEADKVVGVSPVTFVNQQAIVKFTLKDQNNNVINASNLEISADGLIQTGNTTGTITITPASPTSIIFAALRGIASTTVTLTATVGSDTYTFDKSNVTFTNGQYYEINVKMKKNT